MHSKTEETLGQWLNTLKREACDVEDSLTPYAYTTEGQVHMGKEVSRRHIKMTIFGNAIQLPICAFMAYSMFSHRAFEIMLFSIYLGCIFSWYVLAKKRFKEKWGLIERLEQEAEDWRSDLKNNQEYIDLISPVIDKHKKLFAMNNYQSIKDLLVHKNTNIDDGKHFFLTKRSMLRDVFSPDSSISHIDLVMAMNKVARERILLAGKESWTKDSVGSVNLVTQNATDAFMHSLFEIVSTLIDSVYWVTNTAPEIVGKNTEKDGEVDITDNVVSLFNFRSNTSSSEPLSPHQQSFVELSRLAGLITDIVEPVIDRYRLTTVDRASEALYLNKAQAQLDDLSSEALRACARAQSISGVS